MIALPDANTITRPYRGLSVQEVEVDLADDAEVTRYLVGREAYRRTEWLALVNGGQVALVAISKQSYEPLMSPITAARVLAGPARTVWIEDHAVNVGNATQLAAAAAASGVLDADAFIVKGRYEHVNAIWRPDPLTVVVTEVVPPHPAKLFDMARQVVEFDEDLPPIHLVLDAVDITQLASEVPTSEYLLPCRGSGVDLPGHVSFLDTRPKDRLDWLLIGCERSMQFHRAFYDDEPPQVDLCPHRRSRAIDASTRVLTKCCLLERGVEHSANTATVPWGSSLDEVRLALRLLCGIGPVVEQPRQGAPIAT